MKYYTFQVLFIVPKKDPEFAPDLLRKTTIFCFHTKTKKSPDSVVNQSFS